MLVFTTSRIWFKSVLEECRHHGGVPSDTDVATKDRITIVFVDWNRGIQEQGLVRFDDCFIVASRVGSIVKRGASSSGLVEDRGRVIVGNAMSIELIVGHAFLDSSL